MKKKSLTPSAPLVTVRPPRKRSILRKAAQLGATVIAARVAASTGKKGIVGLVAGAGAKRLIMRYPAGALFVGGAYLAGRLFETRREAERRKTQKLLTDQSDPASANQPIPIRSARRTGEA
ncbi:hypothetical protein SAMIE_1024770 [Sphingobium amiense]|uniref:Uncharacterized protein n=1 Tax=Sphingobium amiense TaxID=135719 RepID=A0A494W6M9_9SPHN|nr:hypothetical protein [Sphingobium amiense]BBD98976.1 hypothetical protein SAMIE_1024770 [Sphingobium amiense]